MRVKWGIVLFVLLIVIYRTYTMVFGQFAATSQFYLYGKKHCTSTGWEKASSKYDKPDVLEQAELSGKVYMVTGANSGVGKEVTTYLASKGAAVYMICRSPERAETARAEIVEKTKNEKVKVLLADVSLEVDIRRIVQEFSVDHGETHLDALVCNAGAMAHERTLTKEGVEITFASHLLFGTYLLGLLAIPFMKKAESGRLIVVSSGGMYNTPFPTWQTATAQVGNFDRQLSYAYAKRGQVLLCERWAVEHPEIQCVSCHPGWTATPAVTAAYSKFEQSLLEPMRTAWQGAEGIAWLCIAKKSEVENGAFYLDRKPQTKHMAGPFFSEGSFTKNSVAQVDIMMQQLHSWSHGGVPQTPGAEAATKSSKSAEAPPPPPKLATDAQGMKEPLQSMDKYMDLQKFMGTWYVIGNIPIPVVEVGLHNATEIYDWNEEKQRIDVTYKYTKPNKAGKQSKVQQFMQKCVVVNKQTNAEWKLTPKFGPFYAPITLPYLVLDCADDYSHCTIGLPDRTLVWFMARKATIEPGLFEEKKKMIEGFGYDMKKFNTCPHNVDIAEKPLGWTQDGEEEDADDAVPESGDGKKKEAESATAAEPETAAD